jgi:hypothetical protein
MVPESAFRWASTAAVMAAGSTVVVVVTASDVDVVAVVPVRAARLAAPDPWLQAEPSMATAANTTRHRRTFTISRV